MDARIEQLGVCEKQGCIPPEQHKPGYEARIRIATDIVVALYVFHVAKHRRVPAPSLARKV